MKKTFCFALALCLIFALCACGGGSGSSAPASGSDIPSLPPLPASDSDVPSLPPLPASDTNLSVPTGSDTPVNIMVLNGTTGFGMARLMSDAADGNSALSYSFSVESDASNVTAALINGDADIAALPTNAAAALYNKTDGGVKLLAINTLGVLYLVADSESESISALSDLEGRTVYVPAQNPSFIFSHICSAAGVNVTVDDTYAQPADLRTAVAAGEVSLAVLPEPMVTIACSANDKLSVALDLTEEWDRAVSEGSLVQGCIVVRSEFLESHPAEVTTFLSEYEESIEYMSSGAEDVGELIESSGVFAKGAVAAKALPKCNLCCITGSEMADAMSAYVDIMLAAAPQSVGGAAPGEDFYVNLSSGK